MPAKTKKTGVEKFKDDIKKWEALSYKFASLGAADTEPTCVFRRCLRNKLNGVAFNIPRSANGWQLYSSMPGVGLAASRLTKALVRCLDSLGQVPISEQEELQEYLD